MKRRSEAGLRGKSQEFDIKIIEEALDDPESRVFILKLLNSSKDILENLKKAFSSENNPVNRRVESPLTLHRRRALERIIRPASAQSNSSEASSTVSETKSIPFDEIFKSVVAYVELQSDGKDKSTGAKALLKSMGAVVSDEFSKNVTHVIFKDGCYETYQRAKLWKVHFVSVLWVEMSRRNGIKMPEKDFPALGCKNYEFDISLLCSQMQKEYEDIIREEVRRSQNFDIPSTSAEETVGKKGNLKWNEIFKTSDSNCNLMRKVTKLNESKNSTDTELSLLTCSIKKKLDKKSKHVKNIEIDDSDTSSSDSEIVLINGHSSKNESSLEEMFEDIPDRDNMDFTCVSEGDDSESKSLITGKVSTKSKKKQVLSSACIDKENQCPSTSFMIENAVTGEKNRKMTRINLSSKFNECVLNEVSDNLSNNRTGSTDNMSSLRISSSSSKKQSTGSTVPSLRLSSGNSISTDMSPLRISSEKLNQERTSSDFSPLRLSSDGNVKIGDDQKRAKRGISENNLNEGELDECSNDKRKKAEVADEPKKKQRNCEKATPGCSKEKGGNGVGVNKRKRRSEIEIDGSENLEKKKRLTRLSMNLRKFENEENISQKTPEKTVKNIEFAPFVNTLPRGRKNIRSRATLNLISRDETNLKPIEEETSNKNKKEMTNQVIVLGNQLVSPPNLDNTKEPSPGCSQFRTQNECLRRSMRFRKLYDPDDVVEMKYRDSTDIELKDDEERRKIRLEKMTKTDTKVEDDNGVPSNIFLTEKAFNYISTKKESEKIPQISERKKPNPEKKRAVSEKKRNKKDVSLLYDSGDEQKELAREILFKEPKTPKSKTKPLVLTQKSWSTCVKNRRSTLEFQENSFKVPKVRTNLKFDKKPTIVCTKMHKSEVELFKQIVKKLGTFEVEDNVSTRTTHLVVGETKRTINMLKAISRGCWILKKEWLTKSLDKKKWLQEDDYEITDFSPAVQKCRLERQAFGTPYNLDIFKDCGSIYIAKRTTPPCSELRDLITLCQGKIVKSPDGANIIVGEYFEGHHCVTEYWILDSITKGKMKNFKKYLMKESTKPTSPYV